MNAVTRSFATRRLYLCVATPSRTRSPGENRLGRSSFVAAMPVASATLNPAASAAYVFSGTGLSAYPDMRSALAPVIVGELVLPQPPLACRRAARLRAVVRRADRVGDRLADAFLIGLRRVAHGLVRLRALSLLAFVRHHDFFAAALPPLRPAAFFCAVAPPCLAEPPEPELLPPRLDAPGELAIRAARSFDMPLSFRASYCFSFFTAIAGLLSMRRSRVRADVSLSIAPLPSLQKTRRSWADTRSLEGQTVRCQPSCG